MPGADAVAAALLPVAMWNREVVSGRARTIKLWVGGEYAELLKRQAPSHVHIRTYGTTAKVTYRYDARRWYKKGYTRGMVVIDEAVARRVKAIYSDPRLLRRAVLRNRDVVVEAFKYYSPRGVTHEKAMEELSQLIGPRNAVKLVRELLEEVGRTRRWLRGMFRRDRAYGLMKKVMACANNRAKAVAFFEGGFDSIWNAPYPLRKEIIKACRDEVVNNIREERELEKAKRYGEEEEEEEYEEEDEV